MIRFLLLLSAPLLILPGATKASAQPTPSEEEAFCLERPDHPACRAILMHFCDQYPDAPICTSDDDDDEDD